LCGLVQCARPRRRWTRLRRLRRWVAAALALFASILAGCGQPTLTLNDAVTIAGCQTPIEALVEHRSPLGDVDQLLGIEVRFFADGAPLGAEKTDRRGFARHCCFVPAETKRIEARATVDGVDVTGQGRLYQWDPTRTILVCDIDETISETRYSTLLDDMEADTGSAPLPDSSATLQALAGRFNIVYMTARPRWLLEKTRRWLVDHGFPDAPVVTAPTLAEALGVQKFKGGQIEEWRTLADHLLIGIGNAETDSEAYAANGLLTIIIDDDDTDDFRAHAVVLRNWAMVGDFFDANRAELEDAERLRQIIATEGMLKRPLIRWQRDSD
jgi:hypothetical protein